MAISYNSQNKPISFYYLLKLLQLLTIAYCSDSTEGSKENVAPSEKSISPASATPGSATSVSAPSKASSVPTTTTTYTVGALANMHEQNF